MSHTSMKTILFGRKTGLRVSEFALGAGNFGTGWGHGAEPAEARKLFDIFVAAGGNFLDAADGYQFGQAEKLLGEFVAAERDPFRGRQQVLAGREPQRRDRRDRQQPEKTWCSRSRPASKLRADRRLADRIQPWPSEPRTGNCCRWPRRWVLASRSGRRSAADS